MIAKANTGTTFGSTIDYLTQEKKNWEVVEAYGVSEDPAQTAKDFELQASQNSRVKTPMLHVSLSHHPDDTTKIIGKEREILNAWIEGMKSQGIDLTQTQYIIIKHNDRKHVHYHLVANRIDNEMKRIKDNFIGLKVKEESKKITKKYGLTIANLKERNAITASLTQSKEAPKVAGTITPKINPYKGFRM